MTKINPHDYFSAPIWTLIEQSIACNIPKKEDFSATDKGMADLLKRSGSDIDKI